MAISFADSITIKAVRNNSINEFKGTYQAGMVEAIAECMEFLGIEPEEIQQYHIRKCIKSELKKEEFEKVLKAAEAAFKKVLAEEFREKLFK